MCITDSYFVEEKSPLTIDTSRDRNTSNYDVEKK